MEVKEGESKGSGSKKTFLIRLVRLRSRSFELNIRENNDHSSKLPWLLRCSCVLAKSDLEHNFYCFQPVDSSKSQRGAYFLWLTMPYSIFNNEKLFIDTKYSQSAQLCPAQLCPFWRNHETVKLAQFWPFLNNKNNFRSFFIFSLQKRKFATRSVFSLIDNALFNI